MPICGPPFPCGIECPHTRDLQVMQPCIIGIMFTYDSFAAANMFSRKHNATRTHFLLT